MAENVRVEIGFNGGASTAASMSEKELKRLQKAVGDDTSGTVELETDGGTLLVRTAHVAYLRAHARDSRIGF
jgi:hypothetical protein